MKVSCFNNIQNILSEYKPVNFVAEAISPWHAIGVDAAVEYLKDKGMEPKGIIFIIPHSVNGVVISENNFNCSKYAGIKFVVVNDIKKQNAELKIWFNYFFTNIKDGIDNQLFAITPYAMNFGLNLMLTLTYPDKSIVSVIVDEGTSNYIENKISWIDRAIKAQRNASPIKKCKIFLKGYLSLTKNDILSGFVYRRNKAINFTMFDVKSKPLEINKTSINYYQKAKAMEILADNEFYNYKDAVVILTQIINGCDNENSGDVLPLKQICGELKSSGFTNIIVKLHPREKNPERFSCLGVTVDKTNQSFERIVSDERSKPKAVLSYYSTALVNAKIFFGINAVSIFHFLNKNQFGSRDYLLNKKFKDAFKNYVAFPKDMSELMDCIKLYDEVNNE